MSLINTKHRTNAKKHDDYYWRKLSGPQLKQERKNQRDDFAQIPSLIGGKSSDLNCISILLRYSLVLIATKVFLVPFL